jgi:hypothetical protein
MGQRPRWVYWASGSEGDDESRKETAGDGRHGNVPDGVDEPRALVWLLAGTSIFIGLVMLFFAIFIREMSARFTNASQ